MFELISTVVYYYADGVAASAIGFTIFQERRCIAVSVSSALHQADMTSILS